MTESPNSQDISTKLERIAKQAKEIQGAGLQTLAHYIDVNWLREAYRRTRKDGALGVDGKSAEQYAEQLEVTAVPTPRLRLRSMWGRRSAYPWMRSLHLASLLRQYQLYFNESRPHQGIGQRVPTKPRPGPRPVQADRGHERARWASRRLPQGSVTHGDLAGRRR
jgi:hypothetical protein